MNPTFVVVTGTDTGVGKTHVSAATARAWTRAGRRVVAVKPIESGCSELTSENEDGAILAGATGQAEPRRALVRLSDPVTPALAADRDGVVLDLDALMQRVRQLGNGVDVVLVEGAGGLASPLTWDRDIAYVARGLGARIVLVGADRLGVLNSVRLAMQYLRGGGQSAAAIVLSTPTVDASTGTNAGSLVRTLGHQSGVAERIVVMPHGQTDLSEQDMRVLNDAIFGRAR